MVVQLDSMFLSNNSHLRRNLAQQKASTTSWDVWRDRKLYRNKNLLLACKQIYHEALPLIYSKQKFIFTRLCALQTFLLPMRSETLDLVHCVRVNVGKEEWHMMPAMASLMLKFRFIESLQIYGLGKTTSTRCISKHLKATNRPLSSWPVSLKSFDRLQGIKLAKDMYPFMYPFFNHIIRAGLTAGEVNSPDPDKSSTATVAQSIPKKLGLVTYKKLQISLEDSPQPKPLAGVEKMLQAVSFLEPRRQYGYWQHNQRLLPVFSWFQTLTKKNHTQMTSFGQFDALPEEAMTKERRATMITAMAEELVKLMEMDSC